MRRRIFARAALTVAVSILVLGAVAQASDNQVGSWKVNLAKSKYSPGPVPKEGALTVESQTNGLKITVHGTNASTGTRIVAITSGHHGLHPATELQIEFTLEKEIAWSVQSPTVTGQYCRAA